MQPTEHTLDGQFGRMSQELCPQTMDEISEQSSMKWLKQGRISKNTLCWTRNILESPNDDVGFSLPLALILQQPNDVPTRYYLSAKACEGILRRANRRSKVLPARLQKALEQVVELSMLSETASTTNQLS
jgi:hypothetical protein